MKKRIIPFVVASLSIVATCTSCFTTLALMTASDANNRGNISRENAHLNLKVLQTLSVNEALCVTEKYDVIKFETITETLYDGKQIRGNFTLVNTYTYEAKNGTIKTVPVYVLSKELRKHPEVWKKSGSFNRYL